MRIFKPKFKNAVGELVESPNWHFEFEFAGQRVSESARTASKELAEKAMRKRHRELEEARALGAPLTREDQRDRVRRVSDFVAAYLVRFEQDHASRPNSITYERNRLKTIVRHLGTRIRGQLTDAVMRGYVTRRVDAGVSGSTINGELAALCRTLGTPWKALWPKLPRREEREDVGRALEPEEITRLLAAIDAKPRRKWAGFVIRTLLQTGMRSGELLNARWRQVDFNHEVFTVGRAKTKAGTGRQIPLSGSLRDLFTNYRAMYEKRFGPARSGSSCRRASHSRTTSRDPARASRVHGARSARTPVSPAGYTTAATPRSASWARRACPTP